MKTECNSLWKKKPQARVSIVITSFNYAKYIEQAIVSCSEQGDHVELICVDDCSSDTSVSIIQKNMHRIGIPVLLVKHTRNSGLPKARNSGMRFVRSEFIFTLDADNVILPYALPKLIKLAKTNDSVAVYGKLRKVDENLTPLGGHLSNCPPLLGSIINKNKIDERTDKIDSNNSRKPHRKIAAKTKGFCHWSEQNRHNLDEQISPRLGLSNGAAEKI